MAGHLARCPATRCASRTVSPRSTSPASGCSSPASSRTSVVLPEPFTPTSATRSPGPSRHVTCRSSGRSPKASDDVVGLEHLVAQARAGEAQQLRRVARLGHVGDERVGGLDAELRLRRPRGRPAAQPGELLAHAACGGARRARPRSGRARRARARRPRSRPRTGAPPPSTTSQVAVQTASRNQRSWVTTTSDPRRAARWRASQSTPSTSRWFVGSSSSSSSGPSRSSPGQRDPPALAARQRADRACPGRRGSASTATPPSSPSSTVRNARVARPLVVGAAADELLADGARRIEVVALPEQLELRVARARDARRRRAPRRRR